MKFHFAVKKLYFAVNNFFLDAISFAFFREQSYRLQYAMKQFYFAPSSSYTLSGAVSLCRKKFLPTSIFREAGLLSREQFYFPVSSFTLP